MISLFPNDPQYLSANWVPLDRDPSVWEAHITDLTRKLVPDDVVDISIIWNIKDESKGYGVGSILIVNKHNKQKFVIPLIIKNFKLAPLDTLVTQQHAMRVSKDNIQDMLFSGELAVGTVDRPSRNLSQGYMGDSDMMMPMQTDSQSYSMVVEKDAGMDLRAAWVNQDYEAFAPHDHEFNSILDMVRDTLDKKAIDRAQAALKDPSILNKYANEKSMFVEYIDTADVTQNDMQYKKIDVVKKIGPNAYAMLGSSLESMEPFMDITTGSKLRLELKAQLGEDPLVSTVVDAVEETGERGAVIPWAVDANNATIYTNNDKDLDDAMGVYDAFDSKGQRIKGVLYNEVFDLKLKKKSTKLFITHQGGGIQDSGFKGIVTGIPVSIYNADIINITDKPRAGDYGVLIYAKGVIGPIFVMSASGDVSDGVNDFLVHDGSGEAVKIHFSEYLQGAKVDDPDMWNPSGSKLTTLSISNKFKWCTIPEEIQYKSKSPIEKTGSVLYDMDRYNLRHMDTIISNDLDESQVKFALAHNGYSSRQIHTIIDAAQKAGSCKVLNPVPMPVRSIQKKAHLDIDMGKYELIKIASSIDNLDTVDKILGLNFINDANITRFITVLPLLTNAREELVRLLVISRIGLPEIPETAITQGLDAMDEVIDGLTRLKTQTGDTL